MSIKYCLEALEDLGGADDRDKMRATDMVRTVAFGTSSSSTTPEIPEDKEICIREVVNAAGRAKEVGLDCKVGKLAKKLLLTDQPEFVFNRKNIYCNKKSMDMKNW